jgi:2-polyprenyl-6-methoxyphenol hydroxylase-like FAD-dependent oxidoreductase
MRIGIIGCGIGGLAAASLLARAGHDITLLERFAAPRPLGAGLLLQPSGLAALDCMGLGDAARTMGARVDKLEGRTTKGRLVMNLVYETWKPDAYGLGIHRAALFDLLYGAAREAGAQIVTDADIVRIEGSDAPCAIDAHGRMHGPFQLLIAADGAASSARAFINPKAKAPIYPWGALWAALPAPDESWERCLAQRYQGASIMMGVLPIGRAPEAGDQKHLAFFWSLRRDAFAQWQMEGFDFFKARVAALWPEAGRLLAPHSDPAIFAQATYRDVAARPWRKDRTVLIGDAAHGTSPQLGQGANLALIDALELSAALAANQVDVALDAYVARRNAHVRWFQTMSAALTPTFQSRSAIMGGLRDLLMAPMCEMPPIRRLMLETLCGVAQPPLRNWSPPETIKGP